MNTPIGKWCVVIGDKLENKKRLIENLEHYQKEALEKLKITSVENKSSKVNDSNFQIKKKKK